MKKLIVSFGVMALLVSCKGNSDTDSANENSETELNNTRTDVSEIEGDTMSVNAATGGMDTTDANGAGVGAAADAPGTTSGKMEQVP